jgi:glycosyltransferase involved in cell wall biosynthesis
MLAGDSSADYPHFADELAARGAELGLGERLEMAGFVEDVGELLGRMTVFVNATYRDDRGFGWEGLSGSMLEASWAGLPVVATAAGGTPEGVKDGVTGTLVPEADPAALAGALAPYLRDPALAQATGEAGARFARERFAPQTAAARLFAALAEVVR